MTSASGTWRAERLDVGVGELDRAPGGEAGERLLRAHPPDEEAVGRGAREAASMTPFERPLPEPSRRTSRKIPQKTPKAVRKVRRRFLAARRRSPASGRGRTWRAPIRRAAPRPAGSRRPRGAGEEPGHWRRLRSSSSRRPGATRKSTCGCREEASRARRGFRVRRRGTSSTRHSRATRPQIARDRR